MLESLTDSSVHTFILIYFEWSPQRSPALSLIKALELFIYFLLLE